MYEFTETFVCHWFGVRVDLFCLREVFFGHTVFMLRVNATGDQIVRVWLAHFEGVFTLSLLTLHLELSLHSLHHGTVIELTHFAYSISDVANLLEN